MKHTEITRFLIFLILAMACQPDNRQKRTQFGETNPQKNKETLDQEGEKDKKEPSSGDKPEDNQNSKTSPSEPPKPQDTLNSNDLKSALTYFSSETFEGRASGTEGNRKARDYIIEELKKAEIQPGNGDKWTQEFRYSRSETATTENIIGFIEGTDPVLKNQYLVLGAHMDHLGKQNSTIYYGADDNGSGTISVINIARVLKSKPGGLKRSLVIILFSAEELGLIGSRYYVDNPIYPLEQTVLMLNLDMIGYSRGRLQALGAASANGVEPRLTSILESFPDLDVTITEDSGGRSDHAPFFQKGVPITTFHTGVDHPHYHRPTDTSEKIDYEGLKKITEISIALTETVLNDETFPVNSQLVPFYLHRTPVNDLFDFDTYFEIHGKGHDPKSATEFDHALLPGQPL